MSAIAAASGAAAGANSLIVLISNQTKIGNAGGGGSCSAGVKVLRNGQYHAGSHNSSTNPTYADVGGLEWASRESTAVGDSYDVRMVTVSGTLTVGTADTWQALLTDREYNVSVAGLGAKIFEGTLQIRRGSTTLDTAAISLTALSV